jgi:small subunit ribosomal protein S6
LKTYDGMMIFGTCVKEDDIEKALERAGEEVTKLKGTVDSSRVVGRRSFSRPLHKREAGVYAMMRFTMDPASVAELRGRYKLSDEIFRIQITCADMRVKEPEVSEKEEEANG